MFLEGGLGIDELHARGTPKYSYKARLVELRERKTGLGCFFLPQVSEPSYDLPGSSNGCPIDYPTLLTGLHWAPIGSGRCLQDSKKEPLGVTTVSVVASAFRPGSCPGEASFRGAAGCFAGGVWW